MTAYSSTREVQSGLLRAGYDPGPLDGLFGPKTEAATRVWLNARGKPAAASEGTHPLVAIGFKGAARKLDDIDLPRAGARIGVGEDVIHAVLDVETLGGGWDKQGRPKMLREPHVFYRQLPKHLRARAVAEGLAYQRWGEQPYPRDSYPGLVRAMQIHPEAALRSCSWGLGQILGENFAMIGYGSAAEMVTALLDDEEVHLQMMIDFISAAGLDDELRRRDWAGFARGYNGPAYAKHGYHLRLKSAFEKWQRIPDTPFNIDREADRLELEE